MSLNVLRPNKMAYNIGFFKTMCYPMTQQMQTKSLLTIWQCVCPHTPFSPYVLRCIQTFLAFLLLLLLNALFGRGLSSLLWWCQCTFPPLSSLPPSLLPSCKKTGRGKEGESPPPSPPFLRLIPNQTDQRTHLTHATETEGILIEFRQFGKARHDLALKSRKVIIFKILDTKRVSRKILFYFLLLNMWKMCGISKSKFNQASARWNQESSAAPHATTKTEKEEEEEEEDAPISGVF